LAQQVLQASAVLQQSEHLSLQQVSQAEAVDVQQVLHEAQEDSVATAARARMERIVFIFGKDVFCVWNALV
jgi:hypothetical protein